MRIVFFHVVMSVWLCLLCFYTTRRGRRLEFEIFEYAKRDHKRDRSSMRYGCYGRRIQNDTENFRVSQVAALRAALGLGRTKQEEKRLGFEMVQPIAAGS